MQLFERLTKKDKQINMDIRKKVMQIYHVMCYTEMVSNT